MSAARPASAITVRLTRKPVASVRSVVAISVAPRCVVSRDVPRTASCAYGQGGRAAPSGGVLLPLKSSGSRAAPVPRVPAGVAVARMVAPRVLSHGEQRVVRHGSMGKKVRPLCALRPSFADVWLRGWFPCWPVGDSQACELTCRPLVWRRSFTRPRRRLLGFHAKAAIGGRRPQLCPSRRPRAFRCCRAPRLARRAWCAAAPPSRLR